MHTFLIMPIQVRLVHALHATWLSRGRPIWPHCRAVPLKWGSGGTKVIHGPRVTLLDALVVFPLLIEMWLIVVSPLIFPASTLSPVGDILHLSICLTACMLLLVVHQLDCSLLWLRGWGLTHHLLASKLADLLWVWLSVCLDDHGWGVQCCVASLHFEEVSLMSADLGLNWGWPLMVVSVVDVWMAGHTQASLGLAAIVVVVGSKLHATPWMPPWWHNTCSRCPQLLSIVVLGCVGGLWFLTNGTCPVRCSLWLHGLLEFSLDLDFVIYFSVVLRWQDFKLFCVHAWVLNGLLIFQMNGLNL